MRFPPPSSTHTQLLSLLSSRPITLRDACSLTSINYNTFYSWRRKALDARAIYEAQDCDVASIPPKLLPYLSWWETIEKARAEFANWASQKVTVLGLVDADKGGGVRKKTYKFTPQVQTRQLSNGTVVETPLLDDKGDQIVSRVLDSETVADAPNVLLKILATLDDKWSTTTTTLKGQVGVDHTGQVDVGLVHDLAGLGGISSVDGLVAHLEPAEQSQLLGLLEVAMERAGQVVKEKEKEKEEMEDGDDKDNNLLIVSDVGVDSTTHVIDDNYGLTIAYLPVGVSRKEDED